MIHSESMIHSQRFLVHITDTGLVPPVVVRTAGIRVRCVVGQGKQAQEKGSRLHLPVWGNGGVRELRTHPVALRIEGSCERVENSRVNRLSVHIIDDALGEVPRPLEWGRHRPSTEAVSRKVLIFPVEEEKGALFAVV